MRTSAASPARIFFASRLNGRVALLALLCFVFVYSLSLNAYGQEPGRHRLVLVLCDRLTWDDLSAENCPVLAAEMPNASLGLMNIAVAGPKNPTSATLALALGQQVVSEPQDEQAANGDARGTGEPGTAALIYQRRTGRMLAPGHNLAYLNLASLVRRRLHTVTLGAALNAIRPSRRVLVCGNADTDIRQGRAVLLGMDADGQATGDIALSKPDSAKPYKKSDDVETLARYAADTNADLLIITLGDLARVEAARPHLSPDTYQTGRIDALRRLDTLFLNLLYIRHLDVKQTDVLLVSSCPPAAFPVSAETPETWEHLTPVLALGPDFTPGLLTSPTTRTSGLIANNDVAPTIFPCSTFPFL